VSTQLLAIFLVLFVALVVLFSAWFALAAVNVSGREEQDQAEWERRIATMRALGWADWPPSAKPDYPADPDEDDTTE
jgi:hypothetical protein